jgi:hypothetical protein
MGVWMLSILRQLLIALGDDRHHAAASARLVAFARAWPSLQQK